MSHCSVISQAKLAQRTERIDRGYSLLSPVHDDDLPHLSANSTEIVRHIKAGDWTSRRVLEAFVRSLVTIQYKANPVTEVMLEEAFKRADELDLQFKLDGLLVGPLHGIPFSLKDQIAVSGYDSTLGFSHQAGVPEQEDAPILTILRDAGAILLVKSNVPQTLLAFECSNPVFGTTTNPHSSLHTSGGSSGGEATLIASDSVCFGIGSDVGGSSRIPYGFCGTYSLKTCLGRFVIAGVKSPNAGFESINSSLGAGGRSVADVEALTRVVIDGSVALGKAYNVIPLPYRTVVLPKKLKFGYYTTDGFCRASPVCRRAILETVAALRLQGHECVEFVPPSPITAMEIFVALTSVDAYRGLFANLHQDPVEPSLFLTTLGVKLPSVVRWAASSLIGWYDPLMSRLIGASRPKSSGEQQEWVDRRDHFVDAARMAIWGGENRFDAVLCAVQATPALKLGATYDLSPLAIGTILWNVIDSTVGVIPVTYVDPLLDAVTEEFLALDAPGSTLIEGRVYSGKNPAYNSTEMSGLPCGIQIVGGQWEEEKVIEMMKVVDGALGERGFGPGSYTKRELAKVV